MSDPGYRILCVHGMSNEKPDYSVPWKAVFNSYLKFPESNYIEVLWSSMYNHEAAVLTPEEQALAETLCEVFAKRLLTRISEETPVGSELSGISADTDDDMWKDTDVEMPEDADVAVPETEGADVVAPETEEEEAPFVMTPIVHSPEMLNLVNSSIGAFVKYFASRRIRYAVKETLKEQLRSLAESGENISIIAHGWGTVVAYDSLLDLYEELPTLKVTNLFTLGSPLWAVQRVFDKHSGDKPENVTNWKNMYAIGDPIGSWLRPPFRVDRDFPTSPFLLTDPHMGYLVPGNVGVQRDVVAATIVPPTIPVLES